MLSRDTSSPLYTAQTTMPTTMPTIETKLENSLKNRSIACMGESVAFSCESEHGEGLEWRSDSLNIGGRHGAMDIVFTMNDTVGESLPNHIVNYNGSVDFFISVVLNMVNNTANTCRSTLVLTPVAYNSTVVPIPEFHIFCTANDIHETEKKLRYRFAGITDYRYMMVNNNFYLFLNS